MHEDVIEKVTLLPWPKRRRKLSEELSTQQGAVVQAVLVGAEENRQAELNQYKDDECTIQSDEDVDSNAPYFKSFYNSGGADAIMSLTTFSVEEFMQTWTYLD